MKAPVLKMKNGMGYSPMLNKKMGCEVIGCVFGACFSYDEIPRRCEMHKTESDSTSPNLGGVTLPHYANIPTARLSQGMGLQSPL